MRILLPKREQRKFIEKVLSQVSVKQAAKICNLSERTIRDWRREKFLMQKSAMILLSEKTKINQKYTDELIKENTKLSHAQKLAHIGSWGWNKSTNGLTLSDELFEIYGLTHEETDATYELLLEKVHQEDREFTKKMILGTYIFIIELYVRTMK